MAQVTITHIDRGLPLGLPYLVLVNGRPVGMMQNPQAKMQLSDRSSSRDKNLSAGQHRLGIRCGGYLPIPFTKKTITLSVEAEETIDVQEGKFTEVQFENRERWWNILFDIDLLLWLVRLFVTLPEPWGLVYDITSNVSFAIWLLHFYLYRKRYFRFRITHTDTPPAVVHPSELQKKILEYQQKQMRR